MNRLSIIGAATLLLAYTSVVARPIPHPTTDPAYTLTGTITGMETGWVYLQHIQTGKTDSAKVAGEKFVFSGTVGAPEFCRLGIKGPSGNKEFRVGFFLEKGDLKLTAGKSSMEDAIVSGTPVQDEYRALSGKLSAAADWGSYNKTYEAAAAKKDSAQMDSLRKAANEMSLRQKQLAKEYIKSHPSSYVSVIELDNYFSYNPDPVELGELYNGLDPVIQTSYDGKFIKASLDAAIKTAVGRSAPLFKQNDVNGKAISLSSFKGQYVLIDFWASWCGPCRGENPAVVKAYQAYHSKGFSILGVSLDNNKENWLAAIKKDGLDWPQVSDLQGWKNSVAAEYGVTGIPMNFLLDRDGKIVAKGLRGDELEKKLAELVH
jgi:thiol-disulfide isomerase/thioredoxin